MSEENKCVGLDYEMCANTKCPNEEKEPIINGIDVSECFYFINHTPPKGQGDWCGAIHKGACKVYSKDCKYNKDCYFKQLKRLQEENEGLKSLNDFNVQKIEVLQEENEKLYKALEEIRNEIGDLKNINRLINLQKILDIINEALNDRN